MNYTETCTEIHPMLTRLKLLGRTIPCFDYLGYKSGFSIDKPWIFQVRHQTQLKEMASISSELPMASFGCLSWKHSTRNAIPSHNLFHTLRDRR